MKKKTGSEIICENFKIPHQTIFQDYKCSYKGGLTYFGRIYIGQQNVLFIANMFGIIKKCIISIENIKKVQEPSMNSISITQQSIPNDVQYVFSGLKNNHAYILIRALWKKQRIQSEVLKSHDQDDNYVGDQIQKNSNKQKLIDQGNVESSFFTPRNQAQTQKLCEFQLPCSVQQYYLFFLADKAQVYSRKKHLQLRDSKQITISQWKKNQQLQSQVRQIAALIKVSGVPFMNYAHLNQVWKLKRSQNQINLQIITQMSDVPYSNYFVVNNFVKVEKEGQKKCKMTVQVGIVFSKSTYMKNTIVSRTLGDMKQDYLFWFDKVKDSLNKLRNSSKIVNRKSQKHENSSQIEYQSNQQMLEKPSFSYQKQSSHKTKISKNEQKQIIVQINKKVNNLYKIVIILLIVNFFQLAVHIFSSFRQEKVYLRQNDRQVSETSTYEGQKDTKTELQEDQL